MKFSKWFRGASPPDDVQHAPAGLGGVFDSLLNQQLRPRRTMTDPVTGETYDLDERHPLDPKSR